MHEGYPTGDAADVPHLIGCERECRVRALHAGSEREAEAWRGRAEWNRLTLENTRAAIAAAETRGA